MTRDVLHVTGGLEDRANVRSGTQTVKAGAPPAVGAIDQALEKVIELDQFSIQIEDRLFTLQRRVFGDEFPVVDAPPVEIGPSSIARLDHSIDEARRRLDRISDLVGMIERI